MLENPPMASFLAICKALVLHVVGATNLQWRCIHL
ncbi:hypothetical protein BVRB_9g205980 [Beta vulgaris subsp. vulgaris]|uniref:Uncharacterized protein n=1 Tax=Beta vulgaris subsp. vulgaris TaxID=3555 RepID=A0A0J8BLJ6_BETVV|nr:hypothetical protein BVRB_9g205980 [Beta vulgaris subsp. vulgaris]